MIEAWGMGSSQEFCYDETRDGYVPAEGACFLVLEDETRARARGARCYARISGFAEDTLADHPTRKLRRELVEEIAGPAIDEGIDQLPGDLPDPGLHGRHATGGERLP